ncbi:transglutaminase-like domain-containing protein [Mangrovimonas cancribranchiae]|uniref:Transglutaminase-like domain-containing protein n=1 Tax=Mangrovimonas cancribranchiae TaxID=3080055 RepID=A0AAU6NX59_9FLAO
MDIEAVNQSLKRPIKSGKKYEKFFPNASCERTFLGSGNTDFSLEKMQEWTLQHVDQAKAIAKHLNTSNRAKLIKNIHRFLFDHVQYEIDKGDQYIKSPACAWTSRQQGNDCKTYAAFASAILLNLGIPHYFRKVKQAYYNPNYWTHVYVVVPNSNKKNDYLIIDATVADNKEPVMVDKKDLFMSVNLKHYGLAATTQATCSCGCGTCNDSNDALAASKPENTKQKLQTLADNFNALLDVLEHKGVPTYVTDYAMQRVKMFIDKDQNPSMSQVFGQYKSLVQSVITSNGLNASGDETQTDQEYTVVDGAIDSVLTDMEDEDWWSSLFSGIDCWGGSAYDQWELDGDKQKLKNIMANHVSNINQAIANQNMVALSQAVSDFKGAAFVSVKTFNQKIWDNDWNSCTESRLNNIRDFSKVFRDKAIPALDAYLSQYFSVSNSGQTNTYNSESVGLNPLWAGWVRPVKKHNVSVNNYTFKTGVESIPAFIINDFVVNNVIDNQNSNSFFETLTNTVLEVVEEINNDNGGSTTGSTTGNTNTGGSTTGNNNTSGGNVQTASMGGVLPVLLLSGVAYGAYTIYKNKKSETK